MGVVRECGGRGHSAHPPWCSRQCWHFHLVAEASVHIMCGAQYKGNGRTCIKNYRESQDGDLLFSL